MSRIITVLAIVVAFGFGSTAHALPGLDGDNNPVPGAAYIQSTAQP